MTLIFELGGFVIYLSKILNASLILIFAGLVGGCSSDSHPVIPKAGPNTGPTSKVSLGGSVSCVKSLTGAVRCWGWNVSGQLGQDNTTAIGDTVNSMSTLDSINLGSGRTATSISIADNHACALLDNKAVKCWGYNNFGQLGVDNKINAGDGVGVSMAGVSEVNLGAGRTAKQISVASTHSCAILDDDSLKCWGDNSQGQLGRNNMADAGDGVGTAMASLTAINLGVGRTAKQVSAGYRVTCAILDNAALKCWGANNQAELGLDNNINVGDGIGPTVASVSPINLGLNRTAKFVSVGTYFACAILDDDSLKCWGYNMNGQLGQNNQVTVGDGLGTAMSALTPVNFGVGRTVKKIATGVYHVCAILDNDSLICFGANSYGEAGQDSVGDNSNGTGVAVQDLLPVNLGVGRVAREIAAADGDSCAVLDNNDVKCWGQSNGGQLGRNNTDNFGDGVSTAMAALEAIVLGVF